jgi:hypothetical protein
MIQFNTHPTKIRASNHPQNIIKASVQELSAAFKVKRTQILNQQDETLAKKVK